MRRTPLILSCWAAIALYGCASGSDIPPQDQSCTLPDGVEIWTLPIAANPSQAVDIVAVAIDQPIEGLRLIDAQGRARELAVTPAGGPPWSLRARRQALGDGVYRIEVTRGGRTLACSETTLGSQGQDIAPRQWTVATEALYAAWIEHLFDAPPSASMHFSSLEPILSDPSRNFLLDQTLGGDGRTRTADPDCADLPYYLRAYFAWRLGLPMTYRQCTRGSRDAPPTCDDPTLEARFVGGTTTPDEFDMFIQTAMDRVHSGNARTSLDDARTDFYPVPLDRSALWPGTIFADPYGHILMLVKWVPQRAGESGQLLAIDAQPDNSIARKRFWEGTFLFKPMPGADAGFKAFRPLVQEPTGGFRPLGNREIDGSVGPAPFSLEQSGLTPDDFYARMQRLINPAGLEPELAFTATRDALMEQLETRITSVDTGEAYMRDHPGTVIAMPQGAAIFETVGPWEDFATPSRDLRLLIAMRVLETLPERIRRYPQSFVLSGTAANDAAARIAKQHADSLDAYAITYTRTDGSAWRLSLRDIYQRRDALEIAYNPNDCIERRWGASDATRDLDTCRRQAPKDQRARMDAYRPWFRDLVRPPR
jgi:hypothetical protein